MPHCSFIITSNGEHVMILDFERNTSRHMIFAQQKQQIEIFMQISSQNETTWFMNIEQRYKTTQSNNIIGVFWIYWQEKEEDEKTRRTTNTTRQLKFTRILRVFIVHTICIALIIIGIAT